MTTKQYAYKNQVKLLVKAQETFEKSYLLVIVWIKKKKE